MKKFDALKYKEGKADFNNVDERLLISELQRECTHGRILDVGCGDGMLTMKIVEALPECKIVAIDNSSEQIRMAKTSFPGLSFELTNITEYKTDEKFNCVYSFYAFPHIPKSLLHSALVSVREVLERDARFILFTNICLFDTSLATTDEQEACDVLFLNKWPSQINLASLEEMRELFAITGFVEIKEQKLLTGAEIKNYGDMISWMFVLQQRDTQ